MAKEWILNSAMNRWKLNQKKNIGATSKSIRECCPKTVEDWEDYYLLHVNPEIVLEQSGQKLHDKIKTTLAEEIESITLQDCIDYIHDVVINRTYTGYKAEVDVVCDILEKELEMQIYPAPDEWDRNYNVDYFVINRDKFIGFQIKSIKEEKGEPSHIMDIFTKRSMESKGHQQFTSKYGPVFYLYSMKFNDKYVLSNPDILNEIKKEINNG